MSSDSWQTELKILLQQYLMPNERLVLALSGGVDSASLARLLFEFGYSEVIVAHFNHNLRGASAWRDQNLAKNLAKTYKWQFQATTWQQPQHSEKLARGARYQFLTRVLVENNAKYIVTAHHKDDLVETVLFNFLRGTAVAGLRGMKTLSARRKILRPLLAVTKNQLEQFAQRKNLQFQDDETNLDTGYTRNFLRLELIPLIKSRFPQFEQGLIARSNLFADLEQYLDIEIKKAISTLTINSKLGLYDLERFNSLPAFLQSAIIIELMQPVVLSYDNTQEILRFLASSMPGKERSYGDRRIEVRSKGFVVDVV